MQSELWGDHSDEGNLFPGGVTAGPWPHQFVFTGMHFGRCAQDTLHVM